MTHREELFAITADAHHAIQDVGQTLLNVMGAENDGSISDHNLAYFSGYVASLLSVSNSIRKFKSLLENPSNASPTTH